MLYIGAPLCFPMQPPFVEPTMLTHIEALVRRVHNDGIFIQTGLFEILKNATDIFIKSFCAAHEVFEVLIEDGSVGVEVRIEFGFWG